MEDTQPIAPLTDQHKTEWNNFVTNLNGDYPTPQALNQFNGNKKNPTLTPDHIEPMLNEIAAVKANPDITGLKPSYRNGNNMMYPVTEGGKPLNTGGNPSAIPKPNYDDPQSRLNYAAAFTKKYGPLMQGRGDTPLRINEVPDSGSAPVHDMATKVAAKYALDPALLYSSAMEEGMVGMFPDKNKEVDFSGNDKFPVNGFYNFGLDDFSDKVPSLIKKGYLTPDFKSEYVPKVRINEQGRPVNSADFRTTDAALQAKGAIVKDFQDQTDDYANKQGITLSPKAREFFTYAAYNGGAGGMHKMIDEYNKRGLLDGDKFIDVKPQNKSIQDAYQHTLVRVKMADALKSEGLFDNQPATPLQSPPQKGLWESGNKTAYVDSVLAAHKDLDWVQRLHDPNAPTIQVPGQQYRSTHLMSDNGEGYVYPRIVRINGQLKDLGSEDAAEAYARKTGTGIQLTKEQGTWFAANGYKTGTGVLNSIGPDKKPYNNKNYKKQ